MQNSVLLLMGALTLAGCRSIREHSSQARYLALGDSYTIGESVSASERWPVQLAAALKVKGLERVMHFCTPGDGTESAQAPGAAARAGSERPFERLRQRGWADAVPPSAGRKRPVCFVVDPQRIVGVDTLRASAAHPGLLRSIAGRAKVHNTL